MSIKAVIFDMDGVIIDSEPIHTVVAKLTMKDYGIQMTDEELYRYVGISYQDMWEELKKLYSMVDPIDEIVKKQMLHTEMQFGSHKLVSIDGINELLRYLADNNIQTGLASSSPRSLIEMILGNLGVTGYFNAIVSGEEVARCKPEPDIFLKAAALLDIQPADCIVIEDSPHGIRAAKSAGMHTIGYLNPGSGNQNLSSADYIVNSIKEANEIIKAMATA